MKTKFIHVILLFLLFWVTSPNRPCICPDEIKSTVTITSMTVLKVIPVDLCTDCGHSRTCCSTQADLEISSIFGLFGNLEIGEVVAFSRPDFIFAFPAAPKNHQHLRAPPFLGQRLTPYFTNQVLLI